VADANVASVADPGAGADARDGVEPVVFVAAASAAGEFGAVVAVWGAACGPVDCVAIGAPSGGAGTTTTGVAEGGVASLAWAAGNEISPSNSSESTSARNDGREGRCKVVLAVVEVKAVGWVDRYLIRSEAGSKLNLVRQPGDRIHVAARAHTPSFQIRASRFNQGRSIGAGTFAQCNEQGVEIGLNEPAVECVPGVPI